MRTYKLACPRSIPLYTWNGVDFCAMACAVRSGVFRLLLSRPTAFERAQVSRKLSHTHTHEVDVNFWVSIRHRRFIPRPKGLAHVPAGLHLGDAIYLVSAHQYRSLVSEPHIEPIPPSFIFHSVLTGIFPAFNLTSCEMQIGAVFQCSHFSTTHTVYAGIRPPPNLVSHITSSGSNQ